MTVTVGFGRKRGVAVALLMLALGACTQIQDKLADRGNRYCLQAGGLGAAAGAAGGAAVGYGLSHDRRGAALGAVLGGAAGAFGGCRYGVLVADRRQSYESEQARLTAELSNAKETNQSLVQLNSQLSEGLQARKSELASLQGSSRSTQAAVTKKQALQRELAENEQGLHQQLQTAEGELGVHQKTLASLQKRRGNADPAEIARYKTEVAELEQSVTDLRSLTQQYAGVNASVARL